MLRTLFIEGLSSYIWDEMVRKQSPILLDDAVSMALEIEIDQ